MAFANQPRWLQSAFLFSSAVTEADVNVPEEAGQAVNVEIDQWRRNPPGELSMDPVAAR
jgi:hypothetical protein